MELINYFAYGSNMSLIRLLDRVPSAKRIPGYFKLISHTIRFHKVSKKDGSGKADAFEVSTQDDFVLGALFEFDNADYKHLDLAEGYGYGYDKESVSVLDYEGNSHEAVTYYATHINGLLKPYSWYMTHVLRGAEEAGLPESYIQNLEAVKSTQDLDVDRSNKELSLYT